MPSFDIVNTFDMQEIDNAVNTVKRDILTRYDLKGTDADIKLNKTDKNITILANNDMHLAAIRDMLQNRSISRKISLKTYEFLDEEKLSGMRVRQQVNLKEGISKEITSKINKLIKAMKIKVQSQIQGDQLRVSAKKIDDLQRVISELEKLDIEIPLNYVNMKK
ncbi:MAG: YajQ family cyclic di-GMP-binding protein [Candidatus Neomarinimicrobiota bacterium]|nr:YajQ family cyclic di-GMP-binding protein [Candidatus Neomarinimicrobiota bacterium]